MNRGFKCKCGTRFIMIFQEAGQFILVIGFCIKMFANGFCISFVQSVI